MEINEIKKLIAESFSLSKEPQRQADLLEKVEKLTPEKQAELAAVLENEKEEIAQIETKSNSEKIEIYEQISQEATQEIKKINKQNEAKSQLEDVAEAETLLQNI